MSSSELSSEIRIVRVDPADAEQVEAVRELLREYLGWLGTAVCSTRLYEEIESLPEPYAPPTGALFLALDGGDPVGCIGVREHEEDSCEMKRLYVTPAARGRALGRALVERAIAAARELGYGDVLLSTVESMMAPAIAVYRELGFEETEAFRDLSGATDGSGLICMRKVLR